MVNKKYSFSIHPKLLPIVVSLLIVFSSITGFYRINDYYYFIALAISGLGIYLFRKFGSVDRDILLLIIVCIISLLINNPPFYFRAWQRLGAYTLMLFVISPLVCSYYSTQYRKALFNSFWMFCTLLSIGSFISYFLGINFFVRLGEELEIGVGTFSGLMSHSMILGPIAGMATIFTFIHVVTSRSKIRLLYSVAAILCLGACLLSASRAAVGSTLAGCIFSLFIIYRKRLTKLYSIILVVVTIGCATFPIWGGITDLVIQKQERNESMGSAFFSRERKFAARLSEFKSSPIIGIGFCTIDPEYDGVDRSNGQIEPGSSWLAVASMTGTIGFIFFLLIYVKSFLRVTKLKDVYWKGVLCGMLVFFFFHMIVEGYIFAPRSVLSLLFWLIVAIIEGDFNNQLLKQSVNKRFV